MAEKKKESEKKEGRHRSASLEKGGRSILKKKERRKFAKENISRKENLEGGGGKWIKQHLA